MSSTILLSASLNEDFTLIDKREISVEITSQGMKNAPLASESSLRWENNILSGLHPFPCQKYLTVSQHQNSEWPSIRDDPEIVSTSQVGRIWEGVINRLQQALMKDEICNAVLVDKLTHWQQEM